jgi:glyoxylase-like metal-dependent hydrolase (beta-lactamase superfamily II)
VRERLATEQRVRGEVVPPSPPEALPVITFDESLSIHFNGEEIEVLHLPQGHTDGDSMIYFRDSNVVHLGDHFFNGIFPFVDLESGGNVLGLRRNIAKVLDALPEDVRIIPGHGPLTGREGLVRYLQMLDDCIAVVREGVEAGRSLQEIQNGGLPAQYDEWGGFITAPVFIGFVYRSLFSPPD